MIAKHGVGMNLEPSQQKFRKSKSGLNRRTEVTAMKTKAMKAKALKIKVRTTVGWLEVPAFSIPLTYL